MDSRPDTTLRSACLGWIRDLRCEVCSGANARLLGWSAVAAVFVWYLAVMVGLMGLNAGGADSSGYANSARLLREGRLVVEQRRLEEVPGPLRSHVFVPLGFTPRSETEMAPSYPLGLGAIIAAASAGTSLERGMERAMVALLAASLVVVYLLARCCGLGPAWAVLCGAILAACPLLQYISLQVMSDMPALVATTAALLLAWAARRRPWLAAPAGLVFAGAVFLRPTNALLVLALAWLLGLNWRRWLWFGAGGLPLGWLWVWSNQVLFGRWLASGYGDVNGLFAWAHVGPSLRNIAASLPWLLPLAVFVPWGFSRADWPRERRALLAAMLTWVLVCTGCYLFYRCTSEVWWYLRFILPVFPLVIVLAVLGLRRVVALVRGRSRPVARARWAAAAVFALTAMAAGFAVQERAAARWNETRTIGRMEGLYPELDRWAEQQLPGDAVVFCMQVSGALHYARPNILVRWDWVNPEQSRELYAAAARQGRPVYAVLFPFERERVFGEWISGRWTQVGVVRAATIWRLDDPAGAME